MAKTQGSAPQNLDSFRGIDVLAGAPEDLDLPEEIEAAPKRVFDDPTLDPSNPRWLPKKYFQREKQVLVFVKRDQSDVLKDPDHQVEVTIPVSINGFKLDVPMGRAVSIPESYAHFLIDIGMAQPVAFANNSEGTLVS
jgi:hypothetical protein